MENIHNYFFEDARGLYRPVRTVNLDQGNFRARFNMGKALFDLAREAFIKAVSMKNISRAHKLHAQKRLQSISHQE